MKKVTKVIILTFIAVFAVTLNVNAQTKAEVEASNKKMLAASTPCNKAPEAFKDFIAKFSTDQEFLNSRLKLSPEQRSKYADLLVPDNFIAKAPFDKDGEEFFQMWGELQYNKAYLECGWVDSYVEHIFEFIRDGGKWYLGKIVIEE